MAEKVNRRNFLKFLLATATAFPILPKPQILSAYAKEKKLNIDFYGLIHFEHNCANKKTKSNILRVLEEKPYDFVSVEFGDSSLDDLKIIEKNKRKIIRRLDEVGEKYPEVNKLKNTRNILKKRLNGLSHHYTVVNWAEKNKIPVRGIDPRELIIEYNGKTISSRDSFLEYQEAEINSLEKLTLSRAMRMEESFFWSMNLDFIFEVWKNLMDFYKSQKGVPEWFEKNSNKRDFLKDSLMAKNLLSQIEEYDAEQICHFGGSIHFLSFSNLDTLYEIMSEKANCTRAMISANPMTRCNA